MFAPRVFKLNTISRTHVKSGVVLPKKKPIEMFCDRNCRTKKRI